MSEKQQQAEACIMTKSISQRSVATWFTCGGCL